MIRRRAEERTLQRKQSETNSRNLQETGMAAAMPV